MKAIKWFLVGVVVLLLAKLASFYLFPNNAGNVLVQSDTRPDGKFRIVLRRK